MNKLEIAEYIVKVIREELEFAVPLKIVDETRLDELGVDSIALMTIGVYLEEKFNVDLSRRFFLDKPVTIGDLVAIACEAEPYK